jgi:3D (Asp-Asp-Asp) domain-containing protein
MLTVVTMIAFTLFFFHVTAIKNISTAAMPNEGESRDVRQIITITPNENRLIENETTHNKPEEETLEAPPSLLTGGLYTTSPFAPESITRSEDMQIMTKEYANYEYESLRQNLDNNTDNSLLADLPVYNLKVNNTASLLSTRTVSLGMFELTAYCVCIDCTEIWSYEHPRNADNPNYIQTTASGTRPRAGRTVAVDTKIIPFGSVLIINGQAYLAEDRGGAIKGNIIDIFKTDHETALIFGRRYAEVYIVVEEFMQ